ncbi:ABC transporter substrate-binding protein [Ensifer sp. YR511]|uniref:ABC transporter substrate-binding protein n=1 Tax=Ensifer sp. YR511 TaxID=1855294 RepID=UPI00088E4962|nr:ABC transporter substrate-binding protein [Ensifer sp. YR511]SDN73591.1 peptide/nickel transport system substrate-binding protein [Ensifer sp. YR511]
MTKLITGNTRREFLTNMGLMAAAFSFGATTLPSISSAKQNKGGTVNIRLSSDPSSFDPIANTSSIAIAILSPCYSSLVSYDQADPSKIVGDLANAWNVSDDGLTYTFELEPSAKFHDGAPLTAADVKFTFDRVRNPPAGVSSARKNLFRMVSDIATPDAQTVVFKLQRPAPVFLATLASAWMVVLPKHLLESGSLKDQIVGSGPFKFEQYTRGVSVKLARNPDYYRAGKPLVDKLAFYIVPEDSTAYATLLNGQIDIFSEIDGQQAADTKLRYGDKIATLEAPSLSADGISLNVGRKPFDDLRVREAISLAIDRRAAIKFAMQGYATEGGFLPPGPWALSPEQLETVSGYSGNVADNRSAARNLLKDAGYGTGFEVKILARKGVSTHEARAITVKEQLAEIGIKVTVDLKESATYFDQINKHDFDMATTQIGGLGNDPDLIFGEYHTSEGSTNYAGMKDPVVDALFSRQSVEPDTEKRKEVVDDMNIKALKNYAFLVFFWKTDFTSFSKRLHEYYLHSQADNNRKMDGVWLG